jgi:D-alanine-D-alanine ligase-like ATP-grasp enzyme
LNDIKSLKNIIRNKNLKDMLIWNVSDGCNLYKGSYVPSFAKLLNIKFYGSETYAQYIAQDKFKFLSLCEKLNISIPKTILYSFEMNKFLPKTPKKIFSENETLFIKPNFFDNNIGIRCNAKTKLEYLHCNIKEITKTLKSDVLIQNFIDGFDLRVCYIGNNPIKEEKIGILRVTKYIPNQGKREVEFINETEADEIECSVTKYENIDINKKIISDVIKISKFLNLKNYFAFDVRVSQNENKYCFLELNTAPFIINELMINYANIFYNKDIKEVFFESIMNVFQVNKQ